MSHPKAQGAAPARSGPPILSQTKRLYRVTKRRATDTSLFQYLNRLARIVIRCRSAKYALLYLGCLAVALPRLRRALP